jgi:hypothetical protein
MQAIHGLHEHNVVSRHIAPINLALVPELISYGTTTHGECKLAGAATV